MQRHNADPAGERLGDVRHHTVLLGAREPKQPLLIGGVAHKLDIREQFGRLLHFVDEYRGLKTHEKEFRILFGEEHGIGVIQTDISSVFGEMAQHSRLADLSRPCYQHRFKEGAHA